jgi:ribosomal-protein-alanine N-acetyltransferase
MHEIETLRLRLRRFIPEDRDDLYRLYRDPEVMKYLGKGSLTPVETDAMLSALLAQYRYGFGMWAVIDRASNELIGRCGLGFLDQTSEVELGYLLDRAYWGRGLATEGAQAALRYGFEVVKLERIVAVAKPENIASRRVMEKLGLKYEKEARYYNTDVVYYALSQEAYQLADFPYWVRTEKGS